MKIFRSQQQQNEYEYSLFSNCKYTITIEEYIKIKNSIADLPYWLLKSGQGNIILFIGKNKGWLIATDRDVHYFSVFKSSTLISAKTLNYWTELYKKSEL